MTTETIPGTRDIGHRLARGENAFEEVLMHFGGVTREEAEKMFVWMRKKKLVNRDFCSGTISVKHGAYLERDVLGRIRDEACK